MALRLRRSGDIRAAIKHGVSAGRGVVVVHGRARGDSAGPRVGLAVGKGVGSAVVRNTVRRRMRGVVIEQRDALPPDVDLVIRARPSAAGARYPELRRDIDAGVGDVARRLAARAEAGR